VSGLLGLLLVSLSVGLSNFAGAIGIGLSGINARGSEWALPLASSKP
jgi:hypothetical protein